MNGTSTAYQFSLKNSQQMLAVFLFLFYLLLGRLAAAID
jgi:hypothetical protein